VTHFVDEDPIQLRWVVADGGDESFAFPAPGLVRVGQKEAGERMAWKVLDTSTGRA
jgi:hypothetical protein